MAVHGRNYFTTSTNRQIQLLVTDPDGLRLELIFAP